MFEAVSTGWAAPIVFALKKDGSLLFCPDYSKQNVVAIRDSYPLPCKDENINSFGEETVFSTLDANSRYWQIEIDEYGLEEIACNSFHQLYRVIRMPLGLKYALSNLFESNGCDTYLCALIVRSGVSRRHSRLFKVTL